MDDVLLLAVPAFGGLLAIVLFALGVALIRREGQRPVKDGEEKQPEDALEGEAESAVVSQEPEADSGEPPIPDEEPPHVEVPIATLLRDDQTGKLILQVADEQYRSPSDISDHDELAYLKLAASELMSWFSAEEGAEVERPRRTRPAPKPYQEERNMIEELNEILEGKVAEAEEETPSFRLLEGPSGEVRVFVGVESYGLDEVPVPRIRDLIEEAVQEWEGTL